MPVPAAPGTLPSSTLPSQVHPSPAADRPAVVVRSDHAGRRRLQVDALRGSTARAVAVEDAVGPLPGVRAVQAFPRTGAVLLWYSARTLDEAALQDTLTGALAATPAAAVATRLPRSADVTGSDLVRMVVGGAALLLLGGRRYVLRRPPVLGPTSRLFAPEPKCLPCIPF